MFQFTLRDALAIAARNPFFWVMIVGVVMAAAALVIYVCGR